MKNKKAFTLIELIAVLVILAILALIVTPLVLNIIKKARISADKRSIDAYGRSIELAIADYLLDKGTFPTSIGELTIEYRGDKVECETTTLKEDGSVYLAKCTVGGRSVDGYTHGKEETITYESYSIGDEVTYNNVDYYVIADSETSESSVTLLKAEPLTVSEVNQYGGVGTANNYVNMYTTDDTTASYYQKAYDQNGYGGMAYYSRSTCSGGSFDGCISDYDQSDVKKVVDNWALANTQFNDLIEESTGYRVRLATYDELIINTEKQEMCTGSCWNADMLKYDFMYNNKYLYWTMSKYQDTNNYVWLVGQPGYLYVGYRVGDWYGVIRPVIIIKKSAL